MRIILATMSLAVVLIWTTACALLGTALGEETSGQARKAAAYTFTIYATAYQPALIVYSKLPYCGPAPAPCRDRELYRKLYNADALVADCSMAAVKALNEATADLSGVEACAARIEDAKLLFAKAGVVK